MVMCGLTHSGFSSVLPAGSKMCYLCRAWGCPVVSVTGKDNTRVRGSRITTLFDIMILSICLFLGLFQSQKIEGCYEMSS